MIKLLQDILSLKREPGTLILGHEDNWLKSPIEIDPKTALKHLLIFDSERVTTDIFYSNLQHLGTSFFVSDPNSLGYELSKKDDKKKTIKFDVLDPEGEKFNWIPLCTNLEWAYLLSEATLIDYKSKQTLLHYEIMVSLLAALYSHAASLEETPVFCYELVGDLSIANLLEILSQSNSGVARGIEYLLRTQLDDDYLESCLRTLRQKLYSFLDSKTIKDFTSTNKAPDFSILREEEIGIYYVIPNLEQSPILSRLLITCLINQVKDVTGLPVYLFLHEDLSIGYSAILEDVENLTKQNVVLVNALYGSLHQLLEFYGQKEGKQMVRRYHTKVVLGVEAFENSSQYPEISGDTSKLKEKFTFLIMQGFEAPRYGKRILPDYLGENLIHNQQNVVLLLIRHLKKSLSWVELEHGVVVGFCLAFFGMLVLILIDLIKEICQQMYKQ